MLVLIPKFPINGKDSYPAGVTNVLRSIIFNNVEYYICEATDNSLETGDTYEDYSESLKDKKITKLAFMRRFTTQERVALDLASIGETTEAATVRTFLRDLESATYIDLNRQDTKNDVNSLVGTFLTQERADEILKSPVKDIERYKGD